MSIDFKLPDLGENIESGDVVSLLVNEGDVIAADQNVVELETDKAVVEIPCPYAGKVAKIHVKPGDSVPIGALLVTIEALAAAADVPAPADAGPTEAAPEPQAAAAPAPAEVATEREPEPAPAAPQRPAPTAAPARAATTANNGGPAKRREPVAAAASGASVAAGPSTRRLARELGIELENVVGSGPGGRITREDVVAAVRDSAAAGNARRKKGAGAAEGESARDNYGPVRRQPLTKIRKTIAANMAKSASTIPHVTNFDDADISELDRIRKGSMANNVGSGVKLTMMPFVMKAVALALRQHPTLNASLDLESGDVIYKEYVNLGIAVDTERGLVVPAVREVDQLSIPQLAQVLNDVAAKARDNQFSLDDLRGGTFTISNLGAVGGAYSTPIINPPEVAILLVGRSRKMPVIVEERIEPRLIMPLSLSYDHRLVDGAVAARFLNEVINYLEVPGRLLLAT